MVGLAVTILANVCTTVYLHRALAHHALTLAPPVVFVFRVLTWITTGIQPRQWVAVHRKHHAFTGKEGDPHPAELVGWSPVQFKNVAMYRREARNEVTVARYAKDIHEDAWDRRLFDHSLVGPGDRHRVPGRRVRPGGRAARRLRPRQPVPGRQCGGQRHRPPLRSPAVRQHGRQPALAGLHHRRRGLAQQPPRRADLAPPLPPLVRVRPGLAGHPGLPRLGLAKLREPALARIQTAPAAVPRRLAHIRPPAAAAVDGTVPAMQIVAALFVESFNMRQVEGPATRIDLTGVFFSMAAPGPCR